MPFYDCKTCGGTGYTDSLLSACGSGCVASRSPSARGARGPGDICRTPIRVNASQIHQSARHRHHGDRLRFTFTITTGRSSDGQSM